MRFFRCNYWYQIPFFRVSVTIEPGRSLILFVTTNCLIWKFVFIYKSLRMSYRILKLSLFKQFVVTNCSKERPGSIVNETPKNGILMLKDTSNLEYKKSQNLNENHTIAFCVSENPIAIISSSFLQKCGISHVLPEDRSRMRV